MKELNAFKQLYQDLVDRYEKLNIKNIDFEVTYTDSPCLLPGIIRNQELKNKSFPVEHDLTRGVVDRALERLVKMERDLIKLENSLK